MTYIPSFDIARVLVAGDVMLDRYWHGDTARISPEAPVPVVRVLRTEERPGGAANVALNLALLGAKAMVVGVTGDDEAARTLHSTLAAFGIDHHFERLASLDTITKLRVISRHQQLIRLDFEDTPAALDAPGFVDAVASRLEGFSVMVLSDYGKGTLRRVPELIRLGRAAGKVVLADPKGTDFEIYRGASLLKPNRAEFEAVAGTCANERELVERGTSMISELELQALLVTRGDEGMTLLRRDGEPVHLPTHAREVYDVTGAGDTVIATLAAALSAGCALPEAMALANQAAGIVVGKLGTAAVTVAELRRALFEFEEMGRGIVDEDALAALVDGARGQGRRVVMTNGCFDILHAGHVSYLERARRLGDCLVVAVNDDASVRHLKGAHRPVHSLEQRMAVLAGLEAVDWVVPFSGETPERLICRIRPDVLVKGGDYRADEIAGGDCVRATGGEVRVLDYVAGHSTTATIARIQRREPE